MTLETRILRIRATELAAAAVLALMACVGPPAARAQDGADKVVEISIDNFTFTPSDITIAAGTTVRWVNHDDIPHTVVHTAKSFKSKALDTGDSFTTTFGAAGSFSYFCSLHPHMTGTVIVKAGP